MCSILDDIMPLGCARAPSTPSLAMFHRDSYAICLLECDNVCCFRFHFALALPVCWYSC